jgi:1,2-diacylglycerol-3-alpha-glucose alpha-1,2-galactosyltransferase
VVTAHTTGGTLIGSIRGAERLRRPFERYLRRLYDRADLVLAPSAEAADELRRIGIATPIEVVPNGVDPAGFRRTADSRLQARDDLGLPTDTLLVLTVGHLQPRKGVDTVLACARALPSIRFVWVGGEPDVFSAGRTEVLDAMRAAPPNVSFTGVVDRTLVRAYYQAADVFLLPSRHETFGLAPLEAALSRLPLVLSDLDVFREVFGPPGETYLEAADVPATVAAVARLAGSPGLREVLGHRALTAAGRYAAPAVARRTLQAYARAAAGPGASARAGRPTAVERVPAPVPASAGRSAERETSPARRTSSSSNRASGSSRSVPNSVRSWPSR